MNRFANVHTRSGFTLIEIMIVVAIIALLAAVAIPNVLRGRTSANEASAIGNLRALVSSLEMYRSVNNVYPDAFQADMYGTACTAGVAPDPDYGPPSFCLDLMAATRPIVQGYEYLYTPSPTGCDNTASNECNQYTLDAYPDDVGRTGTRAFFVDESGTVRHCTNTTEAQAATVDGNTIDTAPADCA